MAGRSPAIAFLVIAHASLRATAKQSSLSARQEEQRPVKNDRPQRLDCFVAALLAMTDCASLRAGAKQSSLCARQEERRPDKNDRPQRLDCFVAARLAMTDYASLRATAKQFSLCLCGRKNSVASKMIGRKDWIASSLRSSQ
jgi:hypothetical protein